MLEKHVDYTRSLDFKYIYILVANPCDARDCFKLNQTLTCSMSIIES